MTDKNSDYWKVEAGYLGRLKSANIDHTNPDPETGIYLMERRGEL